MGRIRTQEEFIRRLNAVSDSDGTATYQTLIEACADMLLEIGEDSLNPQKVIGTTGYMGTSLPMWEYKDGCFPFHRKDFITGKFQPDPMVILIGKMLNHWGWKAGDDGISYMRLAYISMAKRYHGFASDLDKAWNGIGQWRC